MLKQLIQPKMCEDGIQKRSLI